MNVGEPARRPAAPAAAGTTTVITREITTVQTVAGATTVKQVAAKKAKPLKKGPA